MLPSEYFGLHSQFAPRSVFMCAKLGCHRHLRPDPSEGPLGGGGGARGQPFFVSVSAFAFTQRVNLDKALKPSPI